MHYQVAEATAKSNAKSKVARAYSYYAGVFSRRSGFEGCWFGAEGDAKHGSASGRAGAVAGRGRRVSRGGLTDGFLTGSESDAEGLGGRFVLRLGRGGRATGG